MDRVGRLFVPVLVGIISGIYIFRPIVEDLRFVQSFNILFFFAHLCSFRKNLIKNSKNQPQTTPQISNQQETKKEEPKLQSDKSTDK